ncbi:MULTISPECIES: elongation factor P 5-aminopentanone reductase [Clostridium]|uniref:elongation factor P 5-aminopentanone reductase n=1 Tax=Clostridium TaxID=1485 RepID=UPI000C07C632|nr:MULTISPECIES: SDR family oxidoreductase [Clostridium]MDB2097913.1 SDR family oxidoreductase [Clostridium paraputrificum]MDB2119923.1 SDR family oxidoreductase [Clostridium paraputrificum]MDU1032791.1 SDR family oxidoreductase [Clostridium sp.]MDU2754765.1 SDR family oxidoreductase [Clostridium sp.]MDU2899713.1 SDR family oxidoreductase [Clostridium sp.]
MSKLLGKVAIITGASRGIGRAIAIELGKEGASVVINYSKDEEGANETLEVLRELGVVAYAIKRDVSSFEGAEEIINKTLEHFGKVDIVVNNAARSTLGLFMDATREDIEGLISTNLLGAMYLTKLAIPHMLGKGGAVLNISSMWGEVGASCEVLYSTSKGGLNLFTKALAKEMAPSNIRVNAIAPGVIDTKMNSFLSQEEREELENEIPVGRFGLPEEIGKTAVFLCSDDSSYITGQILRVDGGYI